MFAIAFDLDVAETERRHPRSATQAYADIRRALTACGYEWVQGSVYVQKGGDYRAKAVKSTQKNRSNCDYATQSKTN